MSDQGEVVGIFQYGDTEIHVKFWPIEVLLMVQLNIIDIIYLGVFEERMISVGKKEFLIMEA
ncbi:MAG TPA: hypothetical protein VLF94_08910 [Chlamydiales bacterium]|nr:hypothetical protein [Chlamydiales bacterium]